MRYSVTVTTVAKSVATVATVAKSVASVTEPVAVTEWASVSSVQSQTVAVKMSFSDVYVRFFFSFLGVSSNEDGGNQ